MAREKKKAFANITQEQAEQAMSALAAANTSLKSIEAKMEIEKQKIDNKYQTQITDLKAAKEEPMQILLAYANENKETWGAKSYDLVHGRIGFRTGNPKVEKKKGFTWDAITELLQEHYPDLVRTAYEPNKEAIIAMRDEEGFADVKKKCFVSVVQDESFYAEPKAEELTAA